LTAFKRGENDIDIAQLLVWNGAPHNAFTDLIKFKNAYYCAFREGGDHNSMDGRIRIIKSFDGQIWKSFSVISQGQTDLRDPHFFIDNRNVLCVATNARVKKDIRQNVVYKNLNNDFKYNFEIDVDNDYWLWSFSKLKNKLYSFGYSMQQECFGKSNTQKKSNIVLFQSKNAACTRFDKLASPLIADSSHCPSEASIIFTSKASAVAIIREGPPHKSFIGTSQFPFKSWNWQKFSFFVRGPKLALLPNGKFLLGAGSMIDHKKTYLAIINSENFSVEQMITLPSGGDCGYPGIIIEGDSALISYYSSHEGNTRVYIVKVGLKF
jgi:hypothetical protein